MGVCSGGLEVLMACIAKDKRKKMAIQKTSLIQLVIFFVFGEPGLAHCLHWELSER